MTDEKTFPRLDELTEVLGDILQECERRSMEPPFIFGGVDSSGTVLVFRWSGNGDKIETLATRRADEGDSTSAHFLVVDQNEEVIRAIIKFGEVTYH